MRHKINKMAGVNPITLTTTLSVHGLTLKKMTEINRLARGQGITMCC